MPVSARSRTRHALLEVRERALAGARSAMVSKGVPTWTVRVIP